MAKAKAAGQFLGGIFNNPGIVILGALAIALLFFQKDIRSAFGSLGESISGGLGDINIQLPEIKFPEIKFPSFDFGGLFGGVEFPQFPSLPPGGIEGIPLDPEGVNPPGAPTAPTPIDVALSEGATPAEIAAIIPPDPTDPNLDPTKFLPPDIGPKVITPAGINLDEFLTPDPFIGPPQPTFEGPQSNLFNQGQLNIGQEQPFTEAPLGALSLSAIIEKFMVTASQAANIKFIAQQGGDPFALAGNIFGENPPAVSDPQFQGLTPEQIFAQLVGGNIQNF